MRTHFPGALQEVRFAARFPLVPKACGYRMNDARQPARPAAIARIGKPEWVCSSSQFFD
jgi:hypothetical protein